MAQVSAFLPPPHTKKKLRFFVFHFLPLHLLEVYIVETNTTATPMPHTEQEILTALRHSREEGFVLLLESFQQPIYWHIRRLVVSHHDSEDVTQEAFMRIYKGLGRFRGEASLKTWVYRIATNEALRWLGKRKAEEGLWVHGEKSTQAQEPYINYNDLEAIELQRAIASLPRRQQLVFNLCYYDDMDYEQVGKVVGCKPSAAKANYHLAKNRVEEYLLAHLDK